MERYDRSYGTLDGKNSSRRRSWYAENNLAEIRKKLKPGVELMAVLRVTDTGTARKDCIRH